MTQNFALTPMFTSSLPSQQDLTQEQRTLVSFASLANGYGSLPGPGYIERLNNEYGHKHKHNNRV